MIWIGIDAHKRVHQALALSADGVLGQKTIANTAVGWTELLRWASTWPERIWAVEGSGSLDAGSPSSWLLVARSTAFALSWPFCKVRIRLPRRFAKG